MTIYKDLEDRVFQEFKSSQRESLEDIALDEEEKNKIIFNLSGSEQARLRELRVDYSDFSNHVFFGSAYSGVNFALTRIMDFPFVGELKEVNEWKDLNSGYENWFFDNFPRDHGHIFLTSGSNGPSLIARDYEGKIGWGTGSFTIEAIIDANKDIKERYPILTIEKSEGLNRSINFYLKRDDSSPFSLGLYLEFVSGSSVSVSASFDSFISSSRHVAVSYRSPEAVFYIDGNRVSSASFSSGIATGSWEDFAGDNIVRIGFSKDVRDPMLGAWLGPISGSGGLTSSVADPDGGLGAIDVEDADASAVVFAESISTDVEAGVPYVLDFQLETISGGPKSDIWIKQPGGEYIAVRVDDFLPTVEGIASSSFYDVEISGGVFNASWLPYNLFFTPATTGPLSIEFYPAASNFSSTDPVTTPPTDSFVGSRKIYISSFRTSGSYEAFYSGSIDEVRFWGSRRPEDLISKNKFKPVYANSSGSLQAYYKFNENWLTGAGKVIDHSANGLDAKYSGSFSAASNYVSGNFHPELVDPGDIILDFTNPDVDSFITTQRNSGSAYDQDNPNYILELYPSFMVEDDNTEDTIKFLLLIARHWDRLKLYIEHLSNIYNTTVSNYDDTPGSLLNFAAEHYGIDIGGIYESSDSLQYFYGEDISSGSFPTTIQNVRNQIKRNVLNNLMHFYKTKSTRESIKSALRALGLDDSIISVNEYSIFSGGLKTTREPKVVEKRVFRSTGLDSNYIELPQEAYFSGGSRVSQTFEARVLLDSGSYAASSSFTTASIFEISGVCSVDIYRSNETSSLGRLALVHSESITTMPILTDEFNIFNEKWINVKYDTGNKLNSGFFYVNAAYLDECDNVVNKSASGQYDSPISLPSESVCRVGSRNGNPLIGRVQEVRVWNYSVDDSTFEHHVKDFESLALDNFSERILDDPLFLHLKLDDLTGSTSTSSSIHDYSSNRRGVVAYGISSSYEYNFPGEFIRRLEPSYSYDLNVDNEKVRIRNDSDFRKSDINKDVQYVSVDFSPINVLNKEIIKWMGDIEQFSSIVGYPYLKYRDEISELNSLRYKFFHSRLNDGIDLNGFLDIIEWFDSNFSYFISQLLPLEMRSSLSNFIIEPHILEYNKVKTIFPYTESESSRLISSSISVLNSVTASSFDYIEPADPGRFGAFASASGQVFGPEIEYSGSYLDITNDSQLKSGSKSVNHKDSEVRMVMKRLLSQSVDSQRLSEVYATGYQFNQISSSNWEKQLLNVPKVYLSGVNYIGDTTGLSLTSSQGYRDGTIQPNIEIQETSSVYNVQDQRWLYYKFLGIGGNSNFGGPAWDSGIGYGGGAGQMWQFVNKSIYGFPYKMQNDFWIGGIHIGDTIRWNRAAPEFWAKSSNDAEMRKVVSLWPTAESRNGVRIVVGANGDPLLNGDPAERMGEPIDIEGYNRLYLEIVGVSSVIETRVLSCSIKFQFFDDEYVEQGFEKILSSSLAGNAVQTKNIQNEYELAVEFNSQNGNEPGISESFKVDLERELPSAKYMRVYLDPETNGTLARESAPGGYYNIIVRGVLDNKNESKDIVKFRDG